MTPGKRAFDLVVAVLLGALLLPVLAVLVVVLLAVEGRPVLYIAERMKTPTQGFGLIKLRTMRPAPPGANAGVREPATAARAAPRVRSPFGSCGAGRRRRCRAWANRPDRASPD